MFRVSSTSSSNNVAASASPKYVLKLNSNDVLLGRGKPAINNEGNVKFRRTVLSRKAEYVSTDIRHRKDGIAREIVQAIANRDGRFVRKVESLVEAETLGVPAGATAWVPVDEEIALLKVKQALRALPASAATDVSDDDDADKDVIPDRNASRDSSGHERGNAGTAEGTAAKASKHEDVLVSELKQHGRKKRGVDERDNHQEVGVVSRDGTMNQQDSLRDTHRERNKVARITENRVHAASFDETQESNSGTPSQTRAASQPLHEGQQLPGLGMDRSVAIQLINKVLRLHRAQQDEFMRRRMN